MDKSILKSVRPMVSLEPDDNSFDNELIPLINNAIATLTQIGVGPIEGVYVIDESTTWDELYTEPCLNMIPSYIHDRVAVIFDPPASSAALNAMTEEANRLEWRISVAIDDLKMRGENANGCNKENSL